MIAAGVLQLLQSAFWMVIAVILFVVVADLEDFLDENDAFLLEGTVDEIQTGLTILAVLITLIVITMVVLAILVLRAVNGVRIASAVMQIVFGAVFLLGVFGSASDGDTGGALGGLVALAVSVLVTVLLFLPSSAAYCRDRRSGPVFPQPWSGHYPPGPGPSQYPG